MTAPLNGVTGADLPVLHWQHPTAYDPARVEPVTGNQPYGKPTGGLWTSSPSVWVNSVPTACWVITPHPAARVLVIDHVHDLAAVYATYPRSAPNLFGLMTFLDWVAVADAFDAVWLTSRGVRAAKGTQAFWGWDVETVFFTRPPLTAAPAPEPAR